METLHYSRPLPIPSRPPNLHLQLPAPLTRLPASSSSSSSSSTRITASTLSAGRDDLQQAASASPNNAAGTMLSSPSPRRRSSSPSPTISTSASASASTPRPSQSSPSASSCNSRGLVDSPGTLRGVQDYMVRLPDLLAGAGPTSEPRWFCPLESRAGTPAPAVGSDPPLLLFLPGIDGTGLGIIRHFETLGRMFEIRCLHIPVTDRTPFEGLIKIVESVVQTESLRSPSRPIYLVGDSLGGALALAVASRNPKADLALVLANPSTSFGRNRLQSMIPLLDFLPERIYQGVPYLLSFAVGDPIRMAFATIEKKLPDVDRALAMRNILASLLPTIPVLADILPKETLLWKINLLNSAALYTNSRLHAVQADVLLLASGKDQILPSRDEAERLKRVLKRCTIRYYKDSGHTLLLEDGLDLGTVIRGTKFYRKSTKRDAVSDFMSPTRRELDDVIERYKGYRMLTSPVFLSKTEDGKVVRGLSGVPNDRPMLLVGYHFLMGLELPLLVIEFLKENRVVRGAAHPILLSSFMEGDVPEPGLSDDITIFGALPARKKSFVKALASGESVLLYPGGIREAFHRKGEAYKLFWPDHPEFVRAAARYGVTIVPFGVIGEDDIVELLLDYNEIRSIPLIWGMFKDLNTDALRLRRGETGEVADQDLHLPLVVPKLPPGRMYFLFGKPFRTAGKEELLLKNKEASEEVYCSVKREIEDCLEYLLKRREEDPYRAFFPRILYESIMGGDSNTPTFRL